MSDITCAATDCERPVKSLQLCTMHYQRLRKRGSLDRPCVTCGAVLPPGYRVTCGRECGLAHAAAEQRRWRGNHASPEQRAQNAAVMKAWRQAHPEEWAAIARRRHLKVTYTMTVEEFDSLYARQGNGCAICGRSDADDAGRRLHVDHDHRCCSGKKRSCGECVRGLLCKHCNTMLGSALDDPDRLIAGAIYLISRL